MLKKSTKTLLVLLVITGSVIFLTACSSNQSSEQIIESGIPINDTSEIKHDLTIESGVLTSDDLILSLEGNGSNAALIDADLSIIDMLTYAVQDEYLAHAEYAKIIAIYGDQNPYSNIIEAETTHIAALASVFETYDLTFPEDNAVSYLVIPTSLLEAAQTGVQAEISNIAMYDLFLTYELPDDIRAVFTSLRNASESHLASFEKQVDKLS